MSDRHPAGPSPRLISLSSETGLSLFRQSAGVDMCLRLLEQFVTQDNLAFCAPATIAMMLNSLPIDRPQSPAHPGHKLFTQYNLFDGAGDGCLSRDTVARTGMTLQQASTLARRESVAARAVHAASMSPDSLRTKISEVIRDTRSLLAANYLRTALGQHGSGHFSPIGAYHAEADLVLILDVARYRYVPKWVPLDHLFGAMDTIDDVSGLTRGLLELSVNGQPVALEL